MTELLYMTDCYKKEFDAKVVNVEEIDGRYFVELNKTAFYPKGGGQPNDRGKLVFNSGEYKVTNVIKKDGRVLHEVEGVPHLKIGNQVRGEIDWDRRYYFMRCHTAAHILSAVIHKETGAFITGNNISEDKVRIDFNLEEFDREKFKHYEDEVNRIIKEGHEVRLSLMPREEAFKIPDLVKLKKMLPESIKIIRVVTIDGVDVQACAGTHVKNTSEIKGIEIVKVENKGKNNRRAYFKVKQ